MRTAVVALDVIEATKRYRGELRHALAADAAAPVDEVVWVDADAELLVRADRANLSFDDGIVLVGLPVFSEQTGDAEVEVPFAMAGAEGSTGLVMATQTRPRGPDAVVDRWAEALVAVAWDALVRLAVRAVEPELPAVISATVDGLTVVPSAPPAGEPVA